MKSRGNNYLWCDALFFSIPVILERIIVGGSVKRELERCKSSSNAPLARYSSKRSRYLAVAGQIGCAREPIFLSRGLAAGVELRLALQGQQSTTG